MNTNMMHIGNSPIHLSMSVCLYLSLSPSFLPFLLLLSVCLLLSISISLHLSFSVSLSLSLSLYRSTQYQEQLWEISINIIKDWMSVGILDQFGPTMGFEEEGSRVTESPDLRAEDRDRQVTITEGESGISMITFRSQEKEEEENEVNGVINHHLPNDLEQNIVDERSNKDL